MSGTASSLKAPRSSGVTLSDGTAGSPAGLPGGDAREEAARVEARQLWADLAHARAGGARGGTASAEDALFRFYLPLAHALGDGASGRTVTTETARHAAELGLAQAVLSWPGSDEGFLRFASRCIATVLRHVRTRPSGLHPAHIPPVFPPLPRDRP